MKWSHLPRPKRDEMARVNGQERDICHLFSVVKTVCYRFINRWSWINCLSGWIRMSSSCCICERRNVFLPPSGAHCSGNVGRESATDAADCSFLPQRPFQVIKCRAPTFSFQATNKRQRPRPQFPNECYNISLEEIIFFKNLKIVQIDRNGFKRRKRLSSIFCRRWRSRGFYKYAERGPPSLTCKWAKKETSSPEWNVSVTSASFSVFIFQTGQIFDGNKWTWRIIFERIFFLFIPFDNSFNALTKVIWLRVDPS